MENVETCILCNATGVTRYSGMRDKLFGAAGIWSIRHCQTCDFSWLDPQPIRGDVAKTYEGYHTHESTHREQTFLVSLKNRVERMLLGAEFGYNLPSGTADRFGGRLFVKFLPMAKEIAGSSVMWLDAQSKGRLLDVGCGNGTFLATMRGLGWDVVGVEPDARSARIATETLGLSVSISTVEDANFPSDCFDCITAHQTIEHMHEPIEFLKESLRILKPGGRLVVTTPSVPSFAHRLFRRCWRGLEPPRHLYLFSPRALGICAGRVGFRVDVLRTTARSAWEIWYASRLIRRDGKIDRNFRQALSLRLRLEGLVFQLFQHLLLRFNETIGEQIVLMASKPLLQSD